MARKLSFASTRLAPRGHTDTFFSAFTGAFRNWEQRQKLARLDSEALDDIGLTKAEAENEARRPIWDVPGYWHR